MSYTFLQNLETILDVIGLLMCIATLAYIVRIRLADRRKPAARSAESGFTKEMRDQAEKQAAAGTLETISRVLAKERDNLQLYLGTGLQPAMAGGVPAPNPDGNLPDRQAPVYRAMEKPRRKSGVYSETVELAACGLSASQIADKVHLPKGEVELSIKLRNRRKNSR